VSAGLGSRFGSDLPKQFQNLRGKPVYLRALEPFLELIAEAVIVIPESWQRRVSDQIQLLPYRTKLQLEIGGAFRQESVARGLARLDPGLRYVLVHDAARPYVSTSLISSVLDAAKRYGACIPVLPVCDTVKEIRAGVVVNTLQRNSIGLSQTPQGFEASLLRRAFEKAKALGFRGTDEAALVERLGESVHIVEGSGQNIKVTWPDDLRK
jgi:2-C-methyl-D-erythritol 4-phosphate cytidylyltransferase